jgi:hypothetical protein
MGKADVETFDVTVLAVNLKADTGDVLGGGDELEVGSPEGGLKNRLRLGGDGEGAGNSQNRQGFDEVHWVYKVGIRGDNNHDSSVLGMREISRNGVR